MHARTRRSREIQVRGDGHNLKVHIERARPGDVCSHRNRRRAFRRSHTTPRRACLKSCKTCPTAKIATKMATRAGRRARPPERPATIPMATDISWTSSLHLKLKIMTIFTNMYLPKSPRARMHAGRGEITGDTSRGRSIPTEAFGRENSPRRYL